MTNRAFKNIIFTDCNPKTTAEKIGEFEKAIGLSLPADYREFLLAVNGGLSTVRGFRCIGDPEPAIGAAYDPDWAETLKKYWSAEKVRINDELQRNTYQPRIITQFFGLDAPKGECIQYYCKRAKTILDTPDVRSLIPIGYSNHFFGDNFVGGDITLSLSQSHFGYVYFGNVESKAMRSYTPGYLGPKKLQTLPLQEMESSLVARSFMEFLSVLFPAKTIVHEKYNPPKDFQVKFKDYEDSPNQNYVLEAPEQA